jgi:excinuclease UvrABC nuclease subunit
VRPERAALLEDVPHARGVYLLRDVHGRVLYVGASGDVRARVASHLGDRKDRLPGRDEMARRVRSVRVERTGSPLETLLLEASLIRRHLPPYNRSLRNHDRYAYLRFRDERFPRLQVTAGLEPGGGALYGPWRKEHRAGRVASALRRAFGLRPCRLDLAQRTMFLACDRAGADDCAAPCDASRPEEDYAARIAAARAFLEGRDPGRALETEDDEARELLESSFAMLARLREAVESPDEVLRLPGVLDGEWRVLLVRSGRPVGPVPLPGDPSRAEETLDRLRSLPPPAPWPLARREVDDVKILAAHRDTVPTGDRFEVGVSPHALLLRGG